jgi:hypothetical protein
MSPFSLLASVARTHSPSWKQEMERARAGATVRPSEARAKLSNRINGLTVCLSVGSGAYICAQWKSLASHTRAQGDRPSDRQISTSHLRRDEEYQPFWWAIGPDGRPGRTVRPSGRIKNGSDNVRGARSPGDPRDQLARGRWLSSCQQNANANSVLPRWGRGPVVRN